MKSSSEEITTSEATKEFRQRAQSIADWLSEKSDHIDTVEGVEVERRSLGDRRAILTVYEGGPDERLEIQMSGSPVEADSRMRIRASFGQKLQAETTYSDDPPRIGVNVMGRTPEAAARDIERRLLPDAIQLYNQLLSRIRHRRKRENQREAIAEKINERTRLELSPSRLRGCYYSDRIFFEPEASDQIESRGPQGNGEPKLNAEMEGRNKMTVTVENLGPEAAIAMIRAAEDEIDGTVRQDPPRKRGN